MAYRAEYSREPYNPPVLPEPSDLVVQLKTGFYHIYAPAWKGNRQCCVNFRLYCLIMIPKETPTVKQLKRLLDEGASPTAPLGVDCEEFCLRHLVLWNKTSIHLLATMLDYHVGHIDVTHKSSQGVMALHYAGMCPSCMPLLLEYDYERAKKGLSYDASAITRMFCDTYVGDGEGGLDMIEFHRNALHSTLETAYAHPKFIKWVECRIYGLEILEGWVTRGMQKGEVRIGLQRFLETNVENVLSKTLIRCVSNAVLEFLAPIDIAHGWDQWMH